MTKYAHMSGSVGCLPDDQSGPFDTREDAVESILDMWDDLSAQDHYDMRVDLRDAGAHYFTDAGEAGADYVEIIELTDDEAAEWDDDDA